MMRLSCLLPFALALAPHPSAALQTASPPSDDSAAPSAAAWRTETPPEIDGLGADAAWKGAHRISGFTQLEPDEGSAPSHPTEFHVAYDERNLYVFVRAYDSDPDSILRVLARRDVSSPSDEIEVVVDSYHDRRTGYQFAVNPDGVKRDAAIYNDGDFDSSWDGVWEVETVVDSLGWAAEFRIPLSQLRYPDAPAHTFGLGVLRTIERHPERVSWPAMSRNRPGMASQLATLENLSGLSSSRTVEMTPYVVARSETEALASGGFGRAQALNVGSDVKLRLTPNVTIDATVNPDFGQVEADPAVLNLDAFEVFLREQRPFFVEGTGLYRLALNCYIVVDCSTSEGLFYSRRVGRSPSLSSEYGDGSTPTSTPIAGAAKLTGRTGRGLSLGVLNAVTRSVEGVDGVTVEPLTNHAVLSAQQDFRAGEAGLRLLATAVNRDLDGWTEPFLHSGAYTAALSLRNRFADGKYEVNALIAASRVEGSAEAIARTQSDAVHRYQQPGDDLEYDPGRTSLSGTSWQVKLAKYGGAVTRFETSLVRHSAGFDPNDLGYLRRADRLDWSTWSALRFNEPTSVYRWAQVNGNVWRRWNTSGRVLEMGVNFNGHIGFHNNWDAHAGVTVAGLGATFCDRCTRGGPPVRASRGIYPWFGVNTDSRRTLAPSVWVNLGYDDEGRSRNVSIEPSLSVRVSTRLDARLGLNIRDNQDANQWIANFEEGGATHYAFAHLEQETVSANLRVNYTAGRDLTFQFYGEPFVSTGTYTDIRELSDQPGAEAWDDRYTAYSPPADAPTGFRFRQLKTNLVVRWEYRPGSTLFLAWAHGRQASDGAPSDLTWRRELDDLLDLHPNNTFLVKVAHWLNW